MKRNFIIILFTAFVMSSCGNFTNLYKHKLADKDYGTIVDMMMPYADTFVCVTPNSDRALPGDKLAEFIQSKGAAAIAASNIPKGIETALDLSIAKNRDSDNCSFDYGSRINCYICFANNIYVYCFLSYWCHTTDVLLVF